MPPAVDIADEALDCPWEDLAIRGLAPPTWDLAETLIHAGHHGVLVSSFAPGTGEADRNLVLWRWSDAAPCRVEVINDFSRLPKDDVSWRRR